MSVQVAEIQKKTTQQRRIWREARRKAVHIWRNKRQYYRRQRRRAHACVRKHSRAHACVCVWLSAEVVENLFNRQQSFSVYVFIDWRDQRSKQRILGRNLKKNSVTSCFFPPITIIAACCLCLAVASKAPVNTQGKTFTHQNANGEKNYSNADDYKITFIVYCVCNLKCSLISKLISISLILISQKWLKLNFFC